MDDIVEDGLEKEAVMEVGLEGTAGDFLVGVIKTAGKISSRLSIEVDPINNIQKIIGILFAHVGMIESYPWHHKMKTTLVRELVLDKKYN